MNDSRTSTCPPPGSAPGPRRPDPANDHPLRYVKPRLIRHGDFRDITLGASGGMGESGMNFTTHGFV